MLNRLFIVMILSLALVACGTTEEATDNTADDVAVEIEESVEDTESSDEEADTTDADSDAPEFLLTASGAETFEFETSILFGCRADQFAANTSSFSPKMDLYLPSNIEVGTYPLADYNASADPIYVEGAGVVSVVGETQDDGSTNLYFTDISGEIVIEAIPEEAGGLFVATVTGTLNTSDGESLDIVATYNIDSDEFTYVDCEF